MDVCMASERTAKRVCSVERERERVGERVALWSGALSPALLTNMYFA